MRPRIIALACGVLVLVAGILPWVFNHAGFPAVAGPVALAAVLSAVALHPLAMFSGYWIILFLPDSAVPGLPVTANQLGAGLFGISAVSYWVRGRAHPMNSRLLPLLLIVAIYFAANAAFGEDRARGMLHLRYVLIYAAMATALFASLSCEKALLALAWIILVPTFASACLGLVEAVHKDAASAFTGKWTNELRIRGTAPNSIVFGWNMLFAFPFAFLLFAQLRVARLRYVAIAMGVVILFAAVLTLNRQTFVAIAVMVGMCSFLYSYRDRKIFLVLLGVAALIAIPTVLPLVIKRLATVVQLSRDNSYLERRDAVLVGMEMFKKHPLFGVGLGSFPAVWPNYLPTDYTTYFIQYRERTLLRFPDFNYLALLAETGIVGLALYVTLFVAIVWGAWRKWKAAGNPEERFARNFAATILTLAAFILLTGFIQDTFLYVRIWIFYALALYLSARTVDADESERQI